MSAFVAHIWLLWTSTMPLPRFADPHRPGQTCVHFDWCTFDGKNAVCSTPEPCE